MILSFVTVVALCFSWVAVGAAANNAVSLFGQETSNASANNYSVWSSTVTSYLAENGDGTLTRVEARRDSSVLIETYSADGAVKRSSVSLAYELPIFGGFFAGEDCNYLVFGQSNPEESDSTEVLRVVQYSKSWQRLNSSSVYGANTRVPFEAGSLRMTETGGKLYIHTCHKMYKSSDGLNHQANMTFVLRESDCKVVDSWYEVMNISYGYSSHSFNQFIVTDGGSVYRVDHGDAYPRGVAVTSFSVDKSVTNVKYTVPIIFSGAIGNNATGASIGGAALGTDALLIAGNLNGKGESHGDQNARNIFVLSVGKSLDTQNWHYITSYSDADGVTVRTPQLVKTAADSFLLLWEEYTSADNAVVVRAVRVNGKGQQETGIKTLDVRLSDCAPILTSDGCVTWYAGNGAPLLYKIDPANLGAPVSCSHVWDDGKVTTAPTCRDAGEMTFTCTICGTTKTEPIPVTNEHTFSEWIVTVPATDTADGEETRTCSVCGYEEKRVLESPKKETVTVYYNTNGAETPSWTETASANAAYTVSDVTLPAVVHSVLWDSNGFPADDHMVQMLCLFDGWTLAGDTAPGAVYAGGDRLTTGEADVTLTAHWKEETAACPPLDPVQKDDTLYTFLGWFTEPEGGEEVTSVAVTDDAPENITLFAHWKQEPLTSTDKQVAPFSKGDTDGDGKITSADARLALRASVSLEQYEQGSAQYLAADADSDGKITSADARLILRASVGLEDPAKWQKATPTDATPTDATPTDATPLDATPSDATPSDATPSDATPSDATPTGDDPETDIISKLPLGTPPDSYQVDGDIVEFCLSGNDSTGCVWSISITEGGLMLFNVSYQAEEEQAGLSAGAYRYYFDFLAETAGEVTLEFANIREADGYVCSEYKAVVEIDENRQITVKEFTVKK